MKHWKHLLAVVNDPFAEKQPALLKAAALARRMRARLTLFNAFSFPQPLSNGSGYSSEAILASAREQRELRLQRLGNALRLTTQPKCVVCWDFPPHEAIVREVLSSKPDMVLTDSHRERRLARLVLANTDWELIRTCPCPVWFVRSAQLPRRIETLVAVDPTHAHAKPARLDSLLLASARVLASQVGGKVAMVHAHETLRDALPPMLLGLLRAAPSAHDDLQELTRSIHKLAREQRIEHADCHVREGRVADVIETAVREHNADLLVMGAVSRDSQGTPRIGGSAERVIDHVDCDVLVIKPSGFKTPVSARRPRLRPTSVRKRGANTRTGRADANPIL